MGLAGRIATTGMVAVTAGWLAVGLATAAGLMFLALAISHIRRSGSTKIRQNADNNLQAPDYDGKELR